MRFLFIDTYYPKFLRYYWDSHPKLKSSPYQKQLNSLLAAKFGTADFYSANLNSLGQQATDIIANDQLLQHSWAKENHLVVLPWFTTGNSFPLWMAKTLLAQIKAYRPDVIYLQDLNLLQVDLLLKLKQMAMLVGQIASPLPPSSQLKPFHLILTSFPHYLGMIRHLGVHCEYFRIGFEATMLSIIKSTPRVYDVSFVGSFSPEHAEGTKLLEQLAEAVPLHVWGRGAETLDSHSPLRRHYHGEAWGKDMYRVLASSKIVINRHISTACNYANNMRLYESTGMGAMLITDAKKNLPELFKVGKEVASYRDAGDLIQQVQYYLTNDSSRSRIARAGQKRTLKDHTYTVRMKELLTIIKRYQ